MKTDKWAKRFYIRLNPKIQTHDGYIWHDHYGRYHRIGGPARIWKKDGFALWYRNGKLIKSGHVKL